MCEELINTLLDIPEVVGIIKRWEFSRRMEIESMFNMARRNDICMYVVNEITIREYGRTKRDQTLKNTIMKNGACYLHYN